MFRKLDSVYALPFALWGLNDQPGPITPYSPHWLVFGPDPIGFGDVPRLTVDTKVEDATEYFRGAQDKRRLIQTKLVDLPAREYQASLKKHLSLQFKEGDRVWVRNTTDQLGPHPKLDRIWQGPAEILHKVSTNRYLANLNGKQVILPVGRLKPYILRRDGVHRPPSIITLNVRTSTTTPMLSRISWTMSIGVRFESKQGGPNSPSRAANPGGEPKTGVLISLNGMMSLLSCITSIGTGWTTISGTTSRCPLILSGKSSRDWTD